MKPHSQTVEPKPPKHPLPKSGRRPPRAGKSEASESAPSAIDPVRRHKLIAEAAYYRAEKRGFAAGNELQDWLEAEMEIRQLLGQ
jgi:hypothetical protein